MRREMGRDTQQRSSVIGLKLVRTWTSRPANAHVYTDYCILIWASVTWKCLTITRLNYTLDNNPAAAARYALKEQSQKNINCNYQYLQATLEKNKPKRIISRHGNPDPATYLSVCLSVKWVKWVTATTCSVLFLSARRCLFPHSLVKHLTHQLLTRSIVSITLMALLFIYIISAVVAQAAVMTKYSNSWFWHYSQSYIQCIPYFITLNQLHFICMCTKVFFLFFFCANDQGSSLYWLVVDMSGGIHSIAALKVITTLDYKYFELFAKLYII